MKFIKFINKTEGFENALSFAIDHGLLPDRNPHTCIKCGTVGSLKWYKKGQNIHLPYILHCKLRGCSNTIGVEKNSIFDDLSFSLSQGLRLMYFWLLKINEKETANQLKLKEAVVNEWFRNFKEVCAFVIINYTRAIGGPDHIVEVAEYQLSSQEESNDLWVYTGVDRNTGHNFAIHVENLESELVWPILKNYILPGTLVVNEHFEELTKLENENGKEGMTFVDPKDWPRTENHYHLDEMFSALQEFVYKETNHQQDIKLKELFAYQFLYFNRDGFVDKPVSEIIELFINDVKQVYPGFEKIHI